MNENKYPGFQRFWQAYGLKLSRATAEKAWVKGRCEEIADEIVAAIPAYNKHLAANAWKNKAHASTWLNQRRWEDEYPEAQTRNPWDAIGPSRQQSREDYIRAAIAKNRAEEGNPDMLARLKQAGVPV